MWTSQKPGCCKAVERRSASGAPRALRVPPPQKVQIKIKRNCYLQSVFPVKNHLSPHVCSAAFFFFWFDFSLHSTPHGPRCPPQGVDHAFAPPRHSGAVDAWWWPRGKECDPDMSSGTQDGRQNGIQQRQKVGERKNVCALSLSARVGLFFLSDIEIDLLPSPPLPLGTSWCGCADTLYGRSALSRSNMHDHPIQLVWAEALHLLPSPRSALFVSGSHSTYATVAPANNSRTNSIVGFFHISA